MSTLVLVPATGGNTPCAAALPERHFYRLLRLLQPTCQPVGAAAAARLLPGAARRSTPQHFPCVQRAAHGVCDTSPARLRLEARDPRVHPRMGKHDVGIQDLARSRVIRVGAHSIHSVGGDGPRDGREPEVAGSVVVGPVRVTGRDSANGIAPARLFEGREPRLDTPPHRGPPPLRHGRVDVVRDGQLRLHELPSLHLGHHVHGGIQWLEPPAMDHVDLPVGGPLAQLPRRRRSHLGEVKVPEPNSVVGRPRDRRHVECGKLSQGETDLDGGGLDGHLGIGRIGPGGHQPAVEQGFGQHPGTLCQPRCHIHQPRGAVKGVDCTPVRRLHDRVRGVAPQHHGASAIGHRRRVPGRAGVGARHPAFDPGPLKRAHVPWPGCSAQRRLADRAALPRRPELILWRDKVERAFEVGRLLQPKDAALSRGARLVEQGVCAVASRNQGRDHKFGAQVVLTHLQPKPRLAFLPQHAEEAVRRIVEHLQVVVRRERVEGARGRVGRRLGRRGRSRLTGALMHDIGTEVVHSHKP
mmetsp:Transcript_28161/g.91018  ORF Transcript_28161/g.91018 Transcript_28161/m.91018 type:complete len:525 (+) Transcript_28161:2030-3604(+)|eukprot:scaffold7097_cov112-Isochrysis_galbana.AAC.2